MKKHFHSFAALCFGLILLFCACVSHAQTVSPFMALGNAQFFDNNGNLLLSGVLYSYVAGTTTQQATYTDYTGLYANPDPIPFGSGARSYIWLTSTANYKFVLCLQNDGPYCAPADILFSIDHVPGCAGCSTGGNTFTGTFISGTPNPATTGILELASIDSICWRNTANNANLCISKDTSDVLTWTGATIKLPETSCTAASTGEDYLCPNSATHHLSFNNNNTGYQSVPGVATAGIPGDLAGFAANGIDLLDSGGTPPASTTYAFSATQTFTATSQDQLFRMTLSGNVTSSTLVMTGLPVPSIVSFELTQDGTGGRTFVWPSNVLGAIAPNSAANATSLQQFIWDGTNARAVTLSAVQPAIEASSITQIGTTVSVPANSATNWVTKSVTMPTSGCPCRALVSYGMYFTTGNSGIHVAWADDSSNIFASTQLNGSSSFSNAGMNGTSMSPGTYANSAVVVFHGVFETSASGGATVQTANNSGSAGAQNSWLNVAIMPSN
jgi:hypothetical protein